MDLFSKFLGLSRRKPSGLDNVLHELRVKTLFAIKAYGEIPELKPVVILWRVLQELDNSTKCSARDPKALRKCVSSVYVLYEVVRMYGVISDELRKEIIGLAIDAIELMRKAGRMSWEEVIQLGKLAYNSAEIEASSSTLVALVDKAMSIYRGVVTGVLTAQNQGLGEEAT